MRKAPPGTLGGAAVFSGRADGTAPKIAKEREAVDLFVPRISNKPGTMAVFHVKGGRERTRERTRSSLRSFITGFLVQEQTNDSNEGAFQSKKNLQSGEKKQGLPPGESHLTRESWREACNRAVRSQMWKKKKRGKATKPECFHALLPG